MAELWLECLLFVIYLNRNSCWSIGYWLLDMISRKLAGIFRAHKAAKATKSTVPNREARAGLVKHMNGISEPFRNNTRSPFQRAFGNRCLKCPSKLRFAAFTPRSRSKDWLRCIISSKTRCSPAGVTGFTFAKYSGT